MPEIELAAVLAVTVALAMGGVLKGITGAGSPVIAVPVIAAFYDVRLAVVLMSVPNLATNLWQLWSFRGNLLPGGFARRYAVSGAVGAVIGTVMLATVPSDAITLTLAIVVLAYVALRLSRPDFQLSRETADKGVIAAGTIGGVLQGATGISAPVSVSYLNAMRLDRATFIPTISAFFAAMALVQVPALLAAGLMPVPLLAASALATIPLVAFMFVGEWLGRFVPAAAFDKLILVFLTLLAIRLIWTSLA